MRSMFMLWFAIPAAGCATIAPISSGVSYLPGEGRWATERGSSTLVGSALIREIDGTVRTCAGNPVSLAPSSPYADARMRVLYGGGGFRSVYDERAVEAPDPGYDATVRFATCDGAGNFEFADIPAGRYYAAVSITWARAGGIIEGGALMQVVDVRPESATRIVIAR